MARTPRSPEQPEERAWTPETIRAAVRKIRRRLTDVESFEPLNIRSRQDPDIRVLEASIKETLAEIFGPNSRTFGSFSLAATLDTAGYNMNGTPHREVIEGLVHGKERSITLLKGVIRFFEEKMEDDFPGEPLDQVSLSGSTMISGSGRTGITASAGSLTSSAQVAEHQINVASD